MRQDDALVGYCDGEHDMGDDNWVVTVFLFVATDRSHMMSVITKREDLVYVEHPVLYQVLYHVGWLLEDEFLMLC